MQPPVAPTAGEDGLIVRRPLDLEYLVVVGSEGVQLQLQVPQVPQPHGLEKNR